MITHQNETVLWRGTPAINSAMPAFVFCALLSWLLFPLAVAWFEVGRI